jgi:hypothetical protein
MREFRWCFGTGSAGMSRDERALRKRIGIGPGSICTTRMVTGAGMPQITAISECYRALADSPGGCSGKMRDKHDKLTSE